MEEETPFSLPSPTDTPYRTPSSSRSRRSHTFGSMSPSSSPPPLPSEENSGRRSSRDAVDPATDESISPLDPRRFTPTLHASLVSEILSLRRDLEDKVKNIEHLETDLHATREHNETLSERLTATTKESWSLKRQMQHLEGGTLSALNEIAKERDQAQSDAADLRKRLELSQKKARSQEENAERTQALWNKDRHTWDAERRVLETKVHVVEGRIKVVLDEVARTQWYRHASNDEAGNEDRSAHPESPSKHRNGGFEHRSPSVASDRSDARAYRFSNPAFINDHSTSLADELAHGDGEPDILDDIHEVSRYSLDALPEEHERPMSAQSRRSQKAYRVLGLPLDFDETDMTDLPEAPRTIDIMPSFTEESSEPSEPSPRYVDSGIQYSPPPSPGLRSQLHPTFGTDTFPSIGSDAETSGPQFNNQSGARSSSNGSVTIHPVMVSASSQTIEIQPTLADASANFADNALPTATLLLPTSVKSSCTQTDVVDDSPYYGPGRADQLFAHSVPTIAIIPPSSRPATPTTDIVLPPRTKNASCQVDAAGLAGYISSGMQTEEIRVDQRRIELPARLLPLAGRAHNTGSAKTLANSLPTALPNSSRRRFRVPPSAYPPPVTSARESKESVRDRTLYPPENDNGPLAEDEDHAIHRPVRSSSLFAGFDEPSDDELERMLGEHVDEDDFFRRPPMKFTLRSGRLISHDPVVEEDSETYAAEAGEAAAMEKLRLSEDTLPPNLPRDLTGRQSPPKKTILHNGESHFRQLKRVPSSKQPNFRRAVLISSGTAAHSSSQSKASGPTIVEVDPPPFPVPTRFSSRKVSKSASEGGRSGTPTSGTSPTKKRKGKANKYDLRKARSATSISASHQLMQERSRSPLLNQRVSIVPDLPSLPPLPIHDSHGLQGRQGVTGVKPPPVANRRPSHAKSQSQASSVEQTSVVEAIAQTMVGEWMYKYVRRRKSFGMPESKPTAWDPTRNADEISANVTSSGIRHKRWVWIAPYERAIMWSSKQPISGPALLGKSGRKLTVQSVLDVKDDNPMPRGASPVSQFNRSILVLTPERALKFTATSQERHYVWLTALSFLSHSPLSFGDLAALPPIPQDTAKPPTPTLGGSLRKRTIRDSILMTKSSGRAGPRSFTADAVMQGLANHDNADLAGEYDPISDAAFPPSVPRFSHHTRQRSNTAPRVPPTSFRSFSQKDSVSLPRPSATFSYSTTGATSDRGAYTPSLGMQSMGSRRGSEASTTGPASRRPSASQSNAYSDYVGQASTVKMDAFFERKNGTAKPKGSYRTQQGWKKDAGYWGLEGSDDFTPMDMPIDGSRSPSRLDDPFRGF